MLVAPAPWRRRPEATATASRNPVFASERTHTGRAFFPAAPVWPALVRRSYRR